MGLSHRPLPLPPFHHSISTISRLLTALNSSSILTVLVACLEWPDVLSLLNTSRGSRKIFHTQNLRDAVLSRFVPGYAEALRHRNLNNYHEVPISIHNLDLLLISQRLPLHRYPTHALQLLTALYPTLDEDYITAKLISLSLAHSRFVLLLQALVHSSTSPIPPEAEDTFPKSHRAALSIKQNSRHLTFPPSLSYLKEQQQQQQQQQQEQKKTPPQPYPRSLSKRLKHHSLPVISGSADVPLGLASTIRPSADSLSSMISINNNRDQSNGHEASKKAHRRSIFKQPPVTPPPPEEPRALKIYSSAWRRSTWSNSSSNRSRHPSIDESATLSPTTADLQLPKRRFASAGWPGSSDSSNSSSPITSASPLPRTSTSSPGGSSPSTPPPTVRVSFSPSPIRTTSPHDLILATSRVRAPILRVFVPCTNMATHSENVLACEKNLVDAGLWDHLSTGDIVCNLGYIPPTSDGSATDGDDDSSTSSPTRFGSRGISSNNADNSRTWLLFTGEYLIPYIPPALLPVNNPITLPSPFYYEHIMPIGMNGNNTSNLRFTIGNFPPVRDEAPQLAMINVAGKVKSTKSPSGWLEVRKWVWTARAMRYKPDDMTNLLPGEEMGLGWYGEWVFEGEGTNEGRQMLLDILNHGVVPGGPREWELVRDRSGGGRIWLRMLD